jgi:hypothetical protein
VGGLSCYNQVVNRGVTNVVSIKGIGKMTIALTEGLLNIYTRLGRPESDIKSPTFWLMMDNIVQVWQKVFPYEVKEFNETVSEQRDNERTIMESVKKGFSNSYALPANFYKMVKVFFPNLSMTNKEFIHNFTSRYPFFKTTKNKL